MLSKRLVIHNSHGLHARAAAAIARTAKTFSSGITFAREGQSADAKSVLGLLMLGAPCGAEVAVMAEGCDADDALLAIEQALTSLAHSESQRLARDVLDA